MSKLALEALPLSRAKIAGITERFRSMLPVGEKPRLPIVEIAEFVLPEVIEGYHLRILTEREMRGEEGRKIVGEPTICLREDVYEGACAGNGRDRYTLTHEIGHLILHSDERLALNRATTDRVPAYKDPEWQANTFASFLLMPTKLVREYHDIEEISDDFGVSYEAAEIRREIMIKHDI